MSSLDADPAPVCLPGLPKAVVDLAGARVHVYATHFDYRPDPAVRRTQVEETARIMAADGDVRQVLLGDLNAGPDAPELAPLWERLTDAWSGPQLSQANWPVTAPPHPACRLSRGGPASLARCRSPPAQEPAQVGGGVQPRLAFVSGQMRGHRNGK